MRSPDLPYPHQHTHALLPSRVVSGSWSQNIFSKNIICTVIDQNCVINNYIIRKNFTQFSIEELIEINKDRKNARKNLTPKDHLEIKRIYDLGEKTKAELMQIYNLSNTQMKRIINKKNE